MFGTMINAITAPGETFETIVKEFNLKQALMPIALLMGLALVSGFVLQDLIADMQWEQIEKSIEGNTQISEEQKDEILSNQYDRVYSETGMSAIFTYVSMAISWPMRIAFWSLLASDGGCEPELSSRSRRLPMRRQRGTGRRFVPCTGNSTLQRRLQR